MWKTIQLLFSCMLINSKLYVIIGLIHIMFTMSWLPLLCLGNGISVMFLPSVTGYNGCVEGQIQINVTGNIFGRLNELETVRKNCPQRLHLLIEATVVIIAKSFSKAEQLDKVTAIHYTKSTLTCLTPLTLSPSDSEQLKPTTLTSSKPKVFKASLHLKHPTTYDVLYTQYSIRY